MYISKGGVTLNSNALTEVIHPNSMLAKRKDKISLPKAEPIKIDMNTVERPSYRKAEIHGHSGDTGKEVDRGNYMSRNDIEVKLVSDKPFDPLELT